MWIPDRFGIPEPRKGGSSTLLLSAIHTEGAAHGGQLASNTRVRQRCRSGSIPPSSATLYLHDGGVSGGTHHHGGIGIGC